MIAANDNHPPRPARHRFRTVRLPIIGRVGDGGQVVYVAAPPPRLA